jgi:hypothetical protein
MRGLVTSLDNKELLEITISDVVKISFIEIKNNLCFINDITAIAYIDKISEIAVPNEITFEWREILNSEFIDSEIE